MDSKVFFDGWAGPLRVAVFGVLAYLTLIVVLRSTGKRTLSKMNAFDFIITVASGSTFAAVLLNKSVTLAEGVTAFLMLVLMQYGVALASAHSKRVESLVKSVPTILVWKGTLLEHVMKKERVTKAEVLAACRAEGLASVSEAQAVVLETAGEFSVLTQLPGPDQQSTLEPCSFEPGTGN